MTVVVGLVAGFAAGWAIWSTLRPAYDAPLFARRNVRDADVPVAAGLVLALALLCISSITVAARALAPAELGRPLLSRPLSAVLVAVLGMCLLGLFDDLAAAPGDRGFRGHLGALRRRRLTTGAAKLFGGAAVAVLAVAATGRSQGPQLLADAALVALGANLGNLFDRAPGRLNKLATVTFAVVAISGWDTGRLWPVAVVAGAWLALLLPDLREQLMLGDTGANAIGAVLALGVVMTASPTARLVSLAVVALLNLASELVSFSRVIERVAPLRSLDRLGRKS